MSSSWYGSPVEVESLEQARRKRDDYLRSLDPQPERPESRTGQIEATREFLGHEIRLWAGKGDVGKLKQAIAVFEAYNALHPVT